MKSNKLFKRLFATIMTLALCLSVSVTSFAAEIEIEPQTELTATDQHISVASAGNVIATTNANLSTGSGTFTLTLEQANWSADFTVAILGNNDGMYEISMSHNGNSYYLGKVAGNGLGTDLYTLAYASAGLYTFTVTNVNGQTGAVTAIATVYD